MSMRPSLHPRPRQRMRPLLRALLGLLGLAAGLWLAWLLLSGPQLENDPPLHTPATTAPKPSADTTTAPR